MVIHHVEMNPVGAGGDDILDFLAEFREVGGEQTRGNAVGGAHGGFLKAVRSIRSVSGEF